MKKIDYIGYYQNQNFIFYCLDKNSVQLINIESIKNGSIKVLLSSQDFPVFRIEIPKNSHRHLTKLLPHLVEPYLSDNIEDTKIFQISKNKTHLTVVVAHKDKWNQFINKLNKLGFKVNNIWVDVLCLPKHKTDACLFFTGKDNVLWRSPKDEFYSGNVQLLKSVNEYSKYPIQILNKNLPDREIKLEYLLFRIKLNKPHIIQKKQSVKYSLRLKIISVMLLFSSLFLWTLNLYLNVIQKQRQAQLYYDESVRLFHSVLPQNKKIPTRSYLTNHLSTFIDEYSENKMNDTWAEWIKKLNENLLNYQISIISVEYDGRIPQMIVKLKSENQEAMSDFKKKLESQFNSKVSISNNPGDVFNTLKIKK